MDLNVWGYISTFIDNNEDKCCLMMTCTQISNCNFTFDKRIDIGKINGSKWFDKFTNILVNDTVKLPAGVTQLRFDYKFNKSIKGYIPSTVKKLIFGNKFNRSVKDRIPYGVTHILFGYRFNQSIEGYIPSSVTHLMFNDKMDENGDIFPDDSNMSHFNKSIRNSIPSSITHLILGCDFAERINDCMPNGVTHLVLTSYSYGEYLVGNVIPSSVTNIAMDYEMYKTFETIPSTVTYLSLFECYNDDIINIPTTIKHLRIENMGSNVFREDLIVEVDKQLLWTITAESIKMFVP